MKTEREKRLETLLYNALNTIMDFKVLCDIDIKDFWECEVEDNLQEWFDLMTKQLGCTVAELKEYGGLINCDDIIDEVEEFWKFKG